MLKKLIFASTLILSNIIIGYGQRGNVETFTNTAVLIDYKSKDIINYATGFFYVSNGSMFLITAAHVLFENTKDSTGQVVTSLSSDTISISYYSGDPVIDLVTAAIINTKSLLSQKQIVYDIPRDISIIRIGKSVPNKGFDASALKFKTKHKGLPSAWSKAHSISMNGIIVGDDVYLAGYPKSLTIWFSEQYEFNRPLIRRGVLAGVDIPHQAIVIDCPSYPGNSGGPVVVALNDTLKLVGVVSRFVPLIKKSESLLYHTINTDISNSGYSAITPIDYVNTLIEENFPNN